MDDELRQLRGAAVRVAAVPQEQLGEEAELRDREVRSERGLLSFFPDDADACAAINIKSCQMSEKFNRKKSLTDVRCLDHANVVATVANTADTLLSVLANKTRDVCLLGRRAPAGNDSRELGRDLDELVLEHVETELERLAVDDKTTVQLLLQELQLVPHLV